MLARTTPIVLTRRLGPADARNPEYDAGRSRSPGQLVCVRTGQFAGKVEPNVSTTDACSPRRIVSGYRGSRPGTIRETVKLYLML